jgi:hypothetical protein
MEALNIPDGSQAIVTILEESPEALCRRQKEALTRFLEEVRDCDEPVPEFFDKVQFREIDV